VPDWDLYVQDKARPGSWNMAVDEYLFRSLEESPGTILRFYQWIRPTVSLGYSQKVKNVVDLDFCRKRGIDVVRRMTGGKLVLHFNEVTYSLCSTDTEIFSATLGESYRRISEALMSGLRRMGLSPSLADAPPAEYTRGNLPCFSYPARNEVEVQGRKIIGSAQKRIGTRFLQHGSIPLIDETDLLESVSFLKEREGEVRAISLSEALGKTVSFRWAVDHLIAGFQDYFSHTPRRKALSPVDEKAVKAVEKERYADPSWTGGRR
jgi:lipoate-protein ligase A